MAKTLFQFFHVNWLNCWNKAKVVKLHVMLQFSDMYLYYRNVTSVDIDMSVNCKMQWSAVPLSFCDLSRNAVYMFLSYTLDWIRKLVIKKFMICQLKVFSVVVEMIELLHTCREVLWCSCCEKMPWCAAETRRYVVIADQWIWWLAQCVNSSRTLTLTLICCEFIGKSVLSLYQRCVDMGPRIDICRYPWIFAIRMSFQTIPRIRIGHG